MVDSLTSYLNTNDIVKSTTLLQSQTATKAYDPFAAMNQQNQMNRKATVYDKGMIINILIKYQIIFCQNSSIEINYQHSIDHYDEMEKQLDEVNLSILKDLEEEGKLGLQMRKYSFEST